VLSMVVQPSLGFSLSLERALASLVVVLITLLSHASNYQVDLEENLYKVPEKIHYPILA